MNKLKIYTTLLTLLVTTPIWAAEGEAQVTSAFDWTIENIVMIMGCTVVLSALYLMWTATKVIWRAQTANQFESQGLSHEAAVSKAKKGSFLSYIYQQMDGGVSLEKETDILLNHNYDGIQELDNNLPPWWVGMFYSTIVFAFLYIGIYHFSDIGKLQIAEYEQEVIEAEIAIAAYNAAQKAEKAANLSADNVTQLTVTDRLAAGQANFKSYCVACHGMLGEGIENLGQNVTDKYWIHGGGVKNIFRTISEGVPGKPMVAWKDAISAEEIQELASYIMTLEGTDPPNARPPEGEIYEEGATSEIPKAGETEVGKE
jgi:cytochrome c oxidase cbb3-type subunit 3